METFKRVVEVEAIGGPYDGSLLPVYAPECTVKILERSPFAYKYRLVREDDGTAFWAFAGIIDGIPA